MKKHLLPFLTLGLSLGALSASAQVPNMSAVNAALNQNHMNMQMHQMMHMNMMHRNMSKGSSVLYNPKTRYKVIFKDNTEKDVKSKILFDEQNKSYLEAEDKSVTKNHPQRIQRIYPTDTHSIYKVDVDGNLSPAGLPADSCWLFKVVSGKVNGYSFLPNTTNLHTGYIKFVQKGDGELQKTDVEVLKTMLSDNNKAVMLVYDQKLYHALVEYNKVKPVKK